MTAGGSRLVMMGVLGVACVAGAGELDMLPIGPSDRALLLASTPAGVTYDCRKGDELDAAALAERIGKARVVLLGEDHTDLDQKLFQASVLEALAARGGNLVLGMEFFLRSDAEALQKWGRGDIDEQELLEAVRWYERGNYRFDYYRPIMDVARSHGIPVVGLNVPRSIPSTVNRSGLDGLDEEQRREVGEVRTTGSPEHRYLIARYFGDTVAQMPPGWFDNMYAAQCLWDVVMARSIVADLGPKQTMVVVVGNGHVAYGLGIARRIHEELAAREQPDMEVVTLSPVIAPPPESEDDSEGHPVGHGSMMAGPPPAQFVRSLADYVAAFPNRGGIEAFPRLGLSVEKEADAAPVVTMVWPDTLASGAGFEHGDEILDMNGVAPANAAQLRLMLADIQWRQRLGFTVKRGDEELEVAVLAFPEVAMTETALAPGWTSEPVDDFEPSSPAAVTDAVDEGPQRRSRLLLEGEKPRRVEVLRGEVLEEVYELDDAGRVRRALYLRPLPDGAVEITYERGDDGAVTGTVRRDRTGATLS